MHIWAHRDNAKVPLLKLERCFRNASNELFTAALVSCVCMGFCVKEAANSLLYSTKEPSLIYRFNRTNNFLGLSSQNLFLTLPFHRILLVTLLSTVSPTFFLHPISSLSLSFHSQSLCTPSAPLLFVFFPPPPPYL